MQLNLTVYTVPIGATMRDDFCRELQQLDYGAGVLILPTGLLQEKAQEGYNVAVSGFDTLANKLLNLNGYAYLEEINYRSQQLVVKEVLDYFAEQGEFVYLARLKDKRGFVQHMTALLSQLSRSGATAEEISNALTSLENRGDLARKDREVALIYQGYRNMLKVQGRFDLEGKYRLALKLLREKQTPKLPWQAVYISDFATLDNLQLELLLELAKHCQVKIALCYAKERAVCEVSRTTLEQLEKYVLATPVHGSAPQRQPALQHLVASLGSQRFTKQAADASLRLREYKHQQAELRGVLTEIKQELLVGASLKDYAVAVYDLSNYRGLRLIADEYGIPLTLPKADQLLVQPLTEFILQLLAAVPDSRSGVEAYFALLSSSLGKLLFGTSLEGLVRLQEDCFFKQRSGVQAAVAAKLEGQGMPNLLAQIDGFLAACKPQNTIGGYVEDIAAFLAELALAKELGALYKQGSVQLAGLQNMLNTERLLLESLESLKQDYASCGMDKEVYSLQDFVTAWQEGLRVMGVTLANGRRDGLLVTNAVQLQGTSFKKVYLLGLREGEFPAGNRENWLYNDKERGELQSLGVDLPNTYNAYAADYCLFAGAAAAATERLALSFYRDAEGEESPYIDEVQSLFTDLEIETIEDKPRASLAEALENSADCPAAWLEQQLGSVALQAAQIDKARTGAYNGLLQEPQLLEKLQEGERTHFSASSLSQYVDCPFKYLGTQLWRQQAWGARTEQLDGGTRGSLIHDTVAAFVKTYLRAKPKMDYELLWQRLQELYQANVAKYQAEGRLLNNEYWPLESKQLERVLAWWLNFEVQEQEQWEGFTPMALEKSFGYKEQPVCLKTETQQPVYLRGRVDRIDASASAAFITDYKSGGAPGNGDFDKGRDLQMAFYLLAAEQLCPGKEILGGDYLSLKKYSRLGGVAWKTTGNANINVSGNKKAPAYSSWDEVKAACEAMVLKPVSELYQGHFAVAPSASTACTYCPLKDICRYEVVQQSTTEQEEVSQDE